MTFAEYADYSLTEFLEDDSFIQWVIQQDARSNSFWESFLQAYPEKQKMVREAVSIIKVYRGQDTFSNDGNIDAVWKRIDTSIGQHVAQPKHISRFTLFKIAASITLIAVIGAISWVLVDDGSKTISTSYGEVKAITLPDQSIVMLNGNSTLTYKNNWTNGVPRQVWIKGEAYFDVKHINLDTNAIRAEERFIVHGRDIDIQVLGTSFNVKSRRNKTNIALLSGKIEVNYAHAPTPSGGLVMMPGDYVEYAGQKLLTKKKLLRPHKAATWTVREITFTDPSVGDIMETLQDNYGYAVNVEDKDLMELKIEGEISVTSVQELIAVVSSTLGIRIEESGKEIVIARK
ncbi:MAG: FecR domain-containing protein [Chryseolinea sp.]